MPVVESCPPAVAVAVAFAVRCCAVLSGAVLCRRRSSPTPSTPPSLLSTLSPSPSPPPSLSPSPHRCPFRRPPTPDCRCNRPPRTPPSPTTSVSTRRRDPRTRILPSLLPHCCRRRDTLPVVLCRRLGPRRSCRARWPLVSRCDDPSPVLLAPAEPPLAAAPRDRSSPPSMPCQARPSPSPLTSRLSALATRQSILCTCHSPAGHLPHPTRPSTIASSSPHRQSLSPHLAPPRHTPPSMMPESLRLWSPLTLSPVSRQPRFPPISIIW